MLARTLSATPGDDAAPGGAHLDWAHLADRCFGRAPSVEVLERIAPGGWPRAYGSRTLPSRRHTLHSRPDGPTPSQSVGVAAVDSATRRAASLDSVSDRDLEPAA